MPSRALDDLKDLLHRSVEPEQDREAGERAERKRIAMEESPVGMFHLLVVANLAAEVEGFPDVVVMGLGRRESPAPAIARDAGGTWRWFGSREGFDTIGDGTMAVPVAHGAVLGALGMLNTPGRNEALTRVSGWAAGGPSDFADRILAAVPGLPAHVRSILPGYAQVLSKHLGRPAEGHAYESFAERLVEGLVGLGVDIDAAPRPDDCAPAIVAAYRHDAAMLRALLRAGANPECIDEYGLTPFLLGAAAGDVDVVRACLDRGADPLATTARGRNALHYVVELAANGVVSDAGDIFDLVHDLGLDPHAANEFGHTPAFLVAETLRNDRSGDGQYRRTLERISTWMQAQPRSGPRP